MIERLKVKVAVFLVWEREGKYLFSLRRNTGYRDGFYTVPSGHVDVGELPMSAMVREAEEEIGVVLKEEDLECVHSQFQKDVYADYYFRIRCDAQAFNGEAENKEPEKCGEVRWETLEELGDGVVLKVRYALECIEKRIFFSEIEDDG